MGRIDHAWLDPNFDFAAYDRVRIGEIKTRTDPPSETELQVLREAFESAFLKLGKQISDGGLLVSGEAWWIVQPYRGPFGGRYYNQAAGIDVIATIEGRIVAKIRHAEERQKPRSLTMVFLAEAIAKLLVR